MGRTLAPGRFSKQDPGEAFRRNGLIVALENKGIFGDYLDQLLFEAHGYEHILGSVSQVASDFATMTWDQVQQRFEDKAGAEVALSHYERIAVIGMDTLTDNIVLDNLTGLEMWHIGNTPGQTGDNPKFQLGNAGGGEPFKIKLGPNTKDCKLDLLTDKPFEELLNTLTLDQKRYIANQGLNNNIRVNGQQIYNPSHTGEIIQLNALPTNPYLVRMNGGINHWMADASNVNLAWFRDLNIFLNGLISDGTTLQETQSRFTSLATIGSTPWLFQVNIANRFFTDLAGPPDGDTRIHQRSSSIGGGENKTGTFVNTSNIVTFSSIGNIKNEMRIRGASGRGIPDETDDGTTILRNINTAARTAEMYDALTDAPVFATSGGPTLVNMNNSGAVGGSHDEDAFQNIIGSFDIREVQGSSNITLNETGAFSKLNAGGENTISGVSIGPPNELTDLITFDASDSTAEGGAKTHDQTQPKSSGVYYYYKS